MVNNNQDYRDLKDKLMMEWDKMEDKSKEAWDDVVDRVTDSYEGATDWTDEKVNEARMYFKNMYNDMMHNNHDGDNEEM